MNKKRGGVLLVPYVGLYPEEAVEALKHHDTYNWQLVIEEIGPQYHAYADKLHELWTLCSLAKTDFMVNEGDVVPHQTVLDSFEECANDYCVFTYWIGASYGYGLGCTRFRARMIKENPDLIRVAGTRSNDGLPMEHHYKRMDTRIRDEARERGILKLNDGGRLEPCVHEPPVRHTHIYPMMEPGSPEDEQWAIARFREENA